MTWLLALALLLGASSDYNAEAPKTILDLQQFRTTCSIRIQAKSGKQGVATLVNLNPAINVWYVLQVSWAGASSKLAYHLENAPLRSYCSMKAILPGC